MNNEAINHEELELVRGSGNVFRDFGAAGADAEQLRSILAAHIVKLLDARGLTVREAERITSVAAADFSRIRRAHLHRFSIDRLMTILNRVDCRVEVTVNIRPVSIEQRGQG